MGLGILPNPAVVFTSLPSFNPDMIDRLGLLKAGDALVNPVGQLINTSDGLITSLLSELDSISAEPPGGHTTQDIEDIQDALTSLQTSAGNFLDFTNIQSGVVIPDPSSTTPSLLHLANVGTNSVALDNFLNKTTNNQCGKLIGLFGSLLLGPQLMSEINTYIQQIVALIQQTQTDIAEVVGTLEEFKNAIELSMENDGQQYKNALNDLMMAALAGVLGDFYNDPCGRYVVEKAIGSNKLLDVL